MKSMRLTIALTTLLLTGVLVNCVERIDLVPRDGETNLVVEGSFTTTPKAHAVILSQTTSYPSRPNQLPVKETLSGAEVYIYSTDGDQILLTEEDGGTYRTPANAAAEVGKSYYLEFTYEGKTYRSGEELVRPVTPLDTIYYEYNEPEDVIDVFIDAQDPGTNGDLYRWTYEGFYQVITNLDNDIDCCALCYINAIGREIILHEDTYSNGQPIRRKLVTKLPMQDPTDYLIIVQQQSISVEAYNYYSLLNKQQNSVGDLFDPPPTRLIGNIQEVNGGADEKQVLGFFYAADEKENFAQIRRSQFYVNLGKVSRFGDCRLLSNE
jgi:hypothetical protein